MFVKMIKRHLQVKNTLTIWQLEFEVINIQSQTEHKSMGYYIEEEKIKYQKGNNLVLLHHNTPFASSAHLTQIVSLIKVVLIKHYTKFKVCNHNSNIYIVWTSF